jgi:hypothetical protein
MKAKLYAFLLLIALLPAALLAQPTEASTSLSDEIELGGNTRLLDYIGSIDDMHYALVDNAGSIFIIQLNDKLEFVKEKSVYDHKETDPHSYLKGMILNGQIIVFTKAYSAKLKTTNLCIHVVNPETLDPELKPRIVAQLKLKSSYNPGITGNLFYPLPNKEEFGIRMSPDNKTILAFTFIDTKTNEGEGLWVKLFGHKLDSIYEGVLHLPLKNDLYQLEDVKVDNQGNIYTLGTDFPKKKYHKKSDIPDYQYHLTIFQGRTKESRDILIKLRGKSVGDMGFGVLSNDKVVCYGTWVNSGYFHTRGYFVVQYDSNTGQEISRYESPEMTEFFTEFLDRKLNKIDRIHMENNGAGYYLYKFRDPIIRPDGSFLLLAEQFAVKYRGSDAYSFGVDLYLIDKVSSLVYDDIFVFAVGADGKPIFRTKVPKLQGGTFVGTSGYSYQAMFQENELYLVFNTFAKNLEEENEEKMTRFDKLSGAVLVAARIDEKGLVEFSELHNYQGTNLLFEPSMALLIDGNQIVIPGSGQGMMGKMFKGKSVMQLLRSGK